MCSSVKIYLFVNSLTNQKKFRVAKKITIFYHKTMVFRPTLRIHEMIIFFELGRFNPRKKFFPSFLRTSRPISGKAHKCLTTDVPGGPQKASGIEIFEIRWVVFELQLVKVGANFS